MEQEWTSIQQWIHLIFSFHQREVTKEAMSDLKQVLADHQQKNHFTFAINEQRAVILTFSQGEVIIRHQNNQLIVEIDEDTKKAVYDLKNLVQQQQQQQVPEVQEEEKQETELKRTDIFEELTLFSEEEF